MTAALGDAHVGNVPSERIFWVLWALVTAWLIACALLVSGEYGDGYQTIANSRYLFGDSPSYYFHRGPLAAIALWPVELLVGTFDAGPFAVTPYHLYSALLHSLYLLGCWWALRYTDGSPAARILAFAAAVTTVVFYCYAPYLNHDLLPGLVFLLMIFIAERWLREGSGTDALLLVAIGAAVVLVKQTYALFWVAIVAYALLALLFRWDDARVDARKLGTLLGLAAASGALAWLGYAWFTAAQWADVAWYLRPWQLAVGVSETFGKDAETVFPANLYLENLHNYGVLAMLLVLPGIVLALRGSDARLRMVAVCWLLSVIAIQLVVFKEVRYALFLAPLTAMLIVPAIDRAIRHRALLAAMLVVLAVDQVRGLTVAARQLTSTATIDPVRFFESAGTQGGGRIVASRFISIVYDAESPLLDDSYHGIYHLGAQLIAYLLEGSADVHEVVDTRDLGLAKLEPGDRVYLANREVRRVPPYTPDNAPYMLPDYLAIAGRAERFTLRRQGGGYEVAGHEGSYVMLLPDPAVPDLAPLISTSPFATAQLEKIYGELGEQDSLEVTGVVVDAVCRADRCQYR